MKITRRDLNVLIESYLINEGKAYYHSDGNYEWMYKDGKYFCTKYPSKKEITRKNPEPWTSGKPGYNKVVSYFKDIKDKDKSKTDADNDTSSDAGLYSYSIRGLAQFGVKVADVMMGGLGLPKNFITELFFDFVKMRKRSIGASTLTTSIADCLRIIAADAEKNNLTDKIGGWGDSAHYKRVATSKAYVDRFGAESTGNYNMRENMSGEASIKDSLSSLDPLNNLYNSITHMTIIIKDDKINIKDQYDFNPVVNILGKDQASVTKSATEDPEFFKKEENFKKFMSAALDGKLMIRSKGKWVPEDFLSRAGIENLCRFYEGLFDYKGIPIDITINKQSPNKTLGNLWDIAAYTTDRVQALAGLTGLDTVADAAMSYFDE